MNTKIPSFISVELTREDHEFAKQFAIEQNTAKKAKRVYLNTLAVCAVDTYLQWQEVDTALDLGDCWDSVIRRFNNIADLVLPDIGKVECCPVLPNEKLISLPTEVVEGRVAYVAVQVYEDLSEVKLLGYARATHPMSQEIEIANLEPAKDLIDYLFELKLKTLEVSGKIAIDLNQWLENNFLSTIKYGWQSLEQFLGVNNNQRDLDFSLRNTSTSLGNAITQVKSFNFDSGGDLSVVMLVAIESEVGNKIRVLVQIHPANQHIYLPENLSLVLLSESGDIIQDVQSRSQDNYIQIKRFRLSSDQKIVVRLSIGEITKEEYFLFQ